MSAVIKTRLSASIETNNFTFRLSAAIASSDKGPPGEPHGVEGVDPFCCVFEGGREAGFNRVQVLEVILANQLQGPQQLCQRLLSACFELQLLCDRDTMLTVSKPASDAGCRLIHPVWDCRAGLLMSEYVEYVREVKDKGLAQFEYVKSGKPTKAWVSLACDAALRSRSRAGKAKKKK
jgi:hypothetical protein